MSDAVEVTASVYLTLKEAAGLATELACRPISYSSVRSWCIKFQIGHQMQSGTWMVDQDLLRDHILLRSRRAS